jgi:hypothetical protein
MTRWDIVGIVIVGLVLSLRLGTWLLERRTAQGGKSTQTIRSTDELMQTLATEAVKDAAKQNGLKLDYTPESIRRADEILGKLHEQYVKDPASISIRELASAYGAYIGEVIRRTEPKETKIYWERDSDFGEKTYPLSWPGVGQVFPMAWCHKQIENGDEDSVWAKYRIFKDRSFAQPPQK